MAKAPISREYRIYLALWRKAAVDDHWDKTIKCSSLNMAIAMRQGMYRAIRPFRRGESLDEELRLSAEKFVVYIDKEAHQLIFRERLTLKEMEGMFDTLGLDEEDLLLGDERDIAASLSNFIQRSDPSAESEPERTTPFYTRD